MNAEASIAITATLIASLAIVATVTANVFAIFRTRALLDQRVDNLQKSLNRLWNEFDELHPRQSNPGHREGVKHNHES